MKKLVFLILPIILLLPIFLSLPVHAASDYDDILKVVDTLTIEDIQDSFNKRDYSPDWKSEAQEILDVHCANYPSTCSRSNTFRNFWQDENLNWAVIKVDVARYDIIVSTDPNAKIQFVTLENNDKKVQFYSENTNSFYRFQGFSFGPDSTFLKSENGTVNATPDETKTIINLDAWDSIFLSTFNVVYPPNYSGPIIPDTWQPAQIKRPNISFQINDKKVKIWSNKSSNINIPEYKIKWLITNQTTDDIQPDPIFTQEGYSLPDGQLDFEVPIYGDYAIYAQYADMSGQVINNYDGFNLQQTSIKLTVDGTIQNGNTDNYICDEDGHCTPKNTETFFDIMKFNDFGLSQAITAPLVFITSLPTKSCNPIVLPSFTGSGQNVTLPCLMPIYQANFNAILVIWQTVMTSIVAYLVAINIFARVKKIQDPNDDSIEVVKL